MENLKLTKEIREVNGKLSEEKKKKTEYAFGCIRMSSMYVSVCMPSMYPYVRTNGT